MEKLDNIWQRVNALVPEPQCTTKDGLITSWSDKRPKPTLTQLKAVNLTTIISLPVKLREVKEERDKRMSSLISSNPSENPETFMNYLSCKKIAGTITTQEDSLLGDLMAIYEASLNISIDLSSDLDPVNYNIVNNTLWP